jgi:dsDNA-binding SOS-regulon protein
MFQTNKAADTYNKMLELAKELSNMNNMNKKPENGLLSSNKVRDKMAESIKKEPAYIVGVAFKELREKRMGLNNNE